MKKNDDLMTRGMIEDVTVRSIDEAKRTATFVAATENGVMTWRGKEWLRVAGIDLKRYTKNPVVLDAHDRFATGAVIGKATVKVEGRELIAEVTFADTTRAEEAWKLVRGGFVNAMSVGFIPLAVKDLAENIADGEGPSKVMGPGRVITNSQLFELSIVPVPADEEALRRRMMEEFQMDNGKDTPAPAPAAIPAAPAAPAPEAQRATNVVQLQEIPDETRKRQILAIAPRSLSADFVDGLILQGLSVEDARKRMLEESAKGKKSVGTPEAPAPKAEETEEREVGADLLVRSICAPALS